MSFQVNNAVRRLLSEQDRDPYSTTCGCFDRRYWGWKLIDFPEATFQRNVYPLALLYRNPGSDYHKNSLIRSSILAGLTYASKIQHRDGSFDQAFPNEHSFGATGFLLHSLLEAFKLMYDEVDEGTCNVIGKCLWNAAEFLVKHNEKHGFISNHLAGAALALLVSADYFNERRYQQRAEELVNLVLKHQSPEGWFLEYEGADPGYQTLCLYYLAKIYQLMPSQALRQSLKKAVDFTSYFVHPDGTFGGEYGSRRTSIFYPGGLALLSREFPIAHSITKAMWNSILQGRTVTLFDIDMGNIAPLLINYLCAIESGVLKEEMPTPILPWERSKIQQDFSHASLYIRGTELYYAIVGVSNGMVLKVFDKKTQRALWDDGGYIGQLTNGVLVTTQITLLDRTTNVREDEISSTTSFYKALNLPPTPFKFLLLRLLNLTLMRSILLGNLLKKILVELLISGNCPYPAQLQRRILFKPSEVIVEDIISISPKLQFSWLEFGYRFIPIHMASVKYFEGIQLTNSLLKVPEIDIRRLNQQKLLKIQIAVGVSDA